MESVINVLILTGRFFYHAKGAYQTAIKIIELFNVTDGPDAGSEL